MKKFVLLLIFLSFPTFSLMFKYGIYTMHDFHLFRLFEFTNCISEGIFPCRWSPNSGMGFGEPLFNFYGQVPYLLGQIFRTLSYSVIDSTKAVFILSIVGSGLTMFVLARKYWGNLGGFLSGIFYMYAPYRAVDVWVRGALPESLSFVFFPLIFYFLGDYLSFKKSSSLLWFTLIFSLLLVNHNLSTYMIAPFLFIFWIYHLIRFRTLVSVFPIILSGLLVIFLSAFYVFPVVFENSFTTVAATTQSYYNYQLHYTTLKQLFLDRFWGYGGSGWGPNDNLSLSAGHLHWILPAISGLILFFKRKLKTDQAYYFLLFFSLGLLALFFTHGKSEILWQNVPGMSFVQFPWRFLSPAVMFLSLSVGIFPQIFPSSKNTILVVAIVGVILLNYAFYRPDIWRPISDMEQFSGKLWDEQRSSALQDYWPKSAPVLPDSFAGTEVIFTSGEGTHISAQKMSHSAKFVLDVLSPSASLSLPIVYFPGWVGKLDSKPVLVSPDPAGLISLEVPIGIHEIDVRFVNTPVRNLGNFISLIALIVWVLGLSVTLRYEKK
jgi:hypothetical protein